MRRINYPRRRKSPYRHKVRRHTRRSPTGRIVHVSSYWRGKGKPPANPASKVRNIRMLLHRRYAVTLSYEDGRSESRTVYASNPVAAVREALEKRGRSTSPVKVTLKL